MEKILFILLQFDLQILLRIQYCHEGFRRRL